MGYLGVKAYKGSRLTACLPFIHSCLLYSCFNKGCPKAQKRTWQWRLELWVERVWRWLIEFHGVCQQEKGGKTQIHLLVLFPSGAETREATIKDHEPPLPLIPFGIVATVFLDNVSWNSCVLVLFQRHRLFLGPFSTFDNIVPTIYRHPAQKDVTIFLGPFPDAVETLLFIDTLRTRTRTALWNPTL